MRTPEKPVESVHVEPTVSDATVRPTDSEPARRPVHAKKKKKTKTEAKPRTAAAIAALQARIAKLLRKHKVEEIAAILDMKVPTVYYHTPGQVAKRQADRLAARKGKRHTSSSRELVRDEEERSDVLEVHEGMPMKGSQAIPESARAFMLEALTPFIDANRKAYREMWDERRELTDGELETARQVRKLFGKDPLLSGGK